MANEYIPDENDKKRYEEEIKKTAEFFNRKPARQGSNQDLDKINVNKTDNKDKWVMAKTYRKEPSDKFKKPKVKISQKDSYKKNKKSFVENYEKFDELSTRKVA